MSALTSDSLGRYRVSTITARRLNGARLSSGAALGHVTSHFDTAAPEDRRAPVKP